MAPEATGTIGEVYDVAEQPDQQDTVYVAGAAGLFKSVDGGATATQIPLSAQLDSTAVLTPSIRSIAVWADGRIVLGMNRGFILASEDGGVNWVYGPLLNSSITARGGVPIQAYAQGRLTRSVRNVPLVAFAQLQTLDLYGVDGLARTDDGGKSWTMVKPGRLVTSLDADPDDPSILFVGYRNTIRRSDDGGKSFSPAEPVPINESGGDDVQIWGLAVGKGDWALVIGTSDGRIMRRREGATKWDVVARSPNGRGVEMVALSAREHEPLLAITSGGSAWRLMMP
jgi:hypothetical protein